MSTSAAIPSSARTGSGSVWSRAEFILPVLAVLSLVTLFVHVKVVWGNLAAHPLFVHATVVLIPLAILGAIALSARPGWFDRYGVLVSLVAIAGMSSIFLSKNAGSLLQDAEHNTGMTARLINEHADAADTLTILFVAFTAVLLLAFAGARMAVRPSGVVALDRVAALPAVNLALRGVLVLLALVSAYFVYHVGDLGAQAVWAGQIK